MGLLEESVERFLEEKRIDGYKNDVNIFLTFLEVDKKVNSDTVQYFLQGFRTSGVIESLDYYINDRNLTSVSTAQRYASCIREFLRFLIYKENIPNQELGIELGAPAYDENSYTKRVNTFISQEKRLKETDSFVAIDTKDLKNLIFECNLTLNSPEVFEKAITTSKYYNKYRSALILKLILLTGIKYEVLKSIKNADLNLKHDLITINGFTIHLPPILSEQFEIYQEINQKINPVNSNRENLFIEHNMNLISDKTATTSSFLNDILGRRDLSGLVKYTIIEMIKKGLNESIIKKFTGVGSKIYTECQDYVNSIYDIKADRYLDSKIRSIDIFDYL